MVSTVEEAAAACRLKQRLPDFHLQFTELLERLAQWIGENKQSSNKAFLTTRSEGLLFVVVMNEVKYNAELEQKLTELDIEIAQDEKFDNIRLRRRSKINCPNVHV
jgi:hypothetical protein